MAQKQRQVRMEQKSGLASMQALESRTNEELEAEVRHKAAAQALLGSRAAERYDAQKARKHFRQAIAAARPQERMQLRRMAEASIALAERRPDDLKAHMEKLGQQAPGRRQLFFLRMAGLIAPPKGASTLARIQGVVLLLAIIAAILLIGFGLASLILLPFGTASVANGIGLGVILVIITLGVLFMFGRRKQARQREERAAAGG